MAPSERVRTDKKETINLEQPIKTFQNETAILVRFGTLTSAPKYIIRMSAFGQEVTVKQC